MLHLHNISQNYCCPVTTIFTFVLMEDEITELGFSGYCTVSIIEKPTKRKFDKPGKFVLKC